MSIRSSTLLYETSSLTQQRSLPGQLRPPTPSLTANMSTTTRGPALPPGRTKHHIVVLESIHAPMPTFSFPHTITLHPRTAPNEVEERIKDADIVIACIAPVTPPMLKTATHLGCLCIMAVGIAWLDREAFAKAGVTVTNCPGGNLEAVGEHVLALYLGLRKRVVEMDGAIKGSMEWVEKGTLAGRWDGPPRGVGQEVVGVLGYGNLGTRVEKNFKALGAKEVLIAGRKGSGELREGRTSFEEVMRRASVIVVCVPKGDDTIDLIGENELRMMQKDALVINVARGGIVNEQALATALRERRIGGAAADVLSVEPVAPGMNPLIPDKWKGEEDIPNLILSPHLAWFTQTTIKNYQKMLKDGAERWVDGSLEKDGKIDPIVVTHRELVWR